MSRSSSLSSTSISASELSKNSRQARSRSCEGLDKDGSRWDCARCNCSPIYRWKAYTSSNRREGCGDMTVVSAKRAKHGYLLAEDEGEAYWLLGMLEIVKISGRDTGGEYGLLEITVRAGEGSPWHVHPDEDEWFYVLEGEF